MEESEITGPTAVQKDHQFFVFYAKFKVFHLSRYPSADSHRIKVTSQPTRAAGISAKMTPGNNIPFA